MSPDENHDECPQIERRLVATYLSQSPSQESFIVAAGFILFMGIWTQIYWNDWFGLSEELAAIPENVFSKKEMWRLLSALFIHSDLKHFLSNSYMLFILSFFIYGYFGLSVFPVSSVILAALANAISLVTYDPGVRLMGASGLVYLLAGFWLILYVLIERRKSVVQRILRSIGVGLIILFPTSFEPQISYRTHAFGCIIGIIYGFIYFIRNKKIIRAAEKFEVLVDS